jgi:hypothetical protein
MKRIVQLAVLTALACGAQAAWSEEASIETPVAATESAESYLNLAQVASPVEGQEPVRQAPPARKARNMLKELGLLGDDGFPQKGGPIDN